MTPQPVRSYRDTLEADAALRHQLFLGLFNEGVLIDSRGVGSLSTALGDAEVDRFIEALEAVRARLPVVA